MDEMRNYIAFSPSERRVMEVLWESDRPLRASEVAAKLEPVTGWQLTTVRTFLVRLEKKGAIEVGPLPDSKDSIHYYRPKLGENDIRLAEGESCLNQFFGGNVSGLLASFIESGRISDEELRRIRRLIDEKIDE